jgi:hypothetical protein
MAKTIIIMTDSARIDVRDRNSITRQLASKGWKTWHWFEDVWIVVELPDELSLSELRHELSGIIQPKSHILVVSVPGTPGVSGYLPTAGAEWIREHVQNVKLTPARTPRLNKL